LRDFHEHLDGQFPLDRSRGFRAHDAREPLILQNFRERNVEGRIIAPGPVVEVPPFAVEGYEPFILENALEKTIGKKC